MADLSFTGGFDISEALSDVDQLGDALQSRIDEALGNVSVESFVSTLSAAAADALAEPIAVQADASSIPADVEAAVGSVSGAEVSVTADTEPATTEVAALVSDVESTTVELAVAADTTEAQQSLSDLSDSSTQAEDSLSGTAAASTALGTANTLTSGSIDALSGGVANLAAKAGGAGAAVGGGIIALGGFTVAAVNSLGAAQRLDSTMGDLAERVNTIRVGNLNIDLAELAVQTGSSGSGMRNAASDAFALGTSFGKGRGETADFSAEILALAGRAVALNPRLGETGEVANGLIRALTSGRDRALLPFALGISTVEISARAADVALKDGRDTVTQADKAFAGASLAVEKLGGHLKQDIEEGSKNPILQVRSLAKEFASATTEIAKPLVVPALEALREAEPAVIAVARPLGTLAAATLPAFASALALVAPPLQVVADAIDAVPQPLLAAAAGAVILSGVIDVLTVSEVAGVATTGLFGTALAALTAEVTLSSLTMSTAVPVVGAFVAGYVIGTKIFHAFAGEAKDVGKALSEESAAAHEAAGLTGEELGAAFQKLVEKARAADINGLSPLAVKLRAFRDLAEENTDTAARFALSQDHNSALFRGMVAVLNSVVEAKNHDAAASDEQGTALEQVTDKVDKTSDAYKKAVVQFGAWAAAGAAALGVSQSALDAIATSADTFSQSIEGSIDSATNPFAKFASATEIGQADFEKFFVGSQLAAADWANTITDLIHRGVDEGLLQEIAKAGPGSKPALDAFVAEVDAHGVEWVNSVSHYGDAATAETEKAFRAMVVSTAVHTAEQQLIVEATTADMKDGGTKNLEALLHNSDANLAAMAYGALLNVGAIRGYIAGLPTTTPPIVVPIVAQINPALAGLLPFGRGIDPGLAAYLSSLPPEPRAAGGPVEAGMPYLVNEDTPRSEIFVPDVSGTIYPASLGGSSGAKTWSAGSMGGEAPITIGKVVLEQASPNPVRETVRAMKQLRRGAAMAALG